jgi:hypothetical protein
MPKVLTSNNCIQTFRMRLWLQYNTLSFESFLSSLCIRQFNHTATTAQDKCSIDTMSLLTLDVDHQTSPLKDECNIKPDLEELFEDWIVAECFDSGDLEAHSSFSGQDFDLFDNTSTTLLKSETGGTQNLSVADSQNAHEAEQAWQAIRGFEEQNAASFPSPDQKRCIPSGHLNTVLPSTFSLVSASEQPSSLINREFPNGSLQKSPNSSSNSPSALLFGRNGFHTLTIRNKSRSPRLEPESRDIKKFYKSSHSAAMSTASQCRSISSAQRLDRLAATEQHQFNVVGGLLSPFQSIPLNNHGSQGNTFDAEEALLSPPESGYRQHPNTPVASPIFVQRLLSQPSMDSSQLGGYPPGLTSQPADMNNIVTPVSSQSMQMNGWPSSELRSPHQSSSGQNNEAWYTTDSGVGAQQINGARPQPVGVMGLQDGLGIRYQQQNPDSLNSVNPGIITGAAHQMGTINDGRNDGSRTEQTFIGLNGLARSVSQGMEPSPITNAPTFSASALSQPTYYSPTPMPQQMASQSRRSLQMPYAPFAPHEVRGLSNRTSLPAGLPMPIAPTPTSSKRNKSPRPHHRRSKSNGHYRRKSSSSVPTSPRHALNGFINLTSDDSKKILTGVAPSGSSKTKARREKEAAEKARKIGELAKRAVLQAGGDPKALEQEGLIDIMEGRI